MFKLKSIKDHLPMIVGCGIISLLGIYFSSDYHYKLIDKITTSDVMAILLNYAVIAALIERFSNKIVLRDKYIASNVARNLIHKSDLTIREIRALKGNEKHSDNQSLNEALDVVEEHDTSFSWLSFMIAIVISSFGFRFFINIFCASNETDINMFVDIFLTSILLSGGAQYIKSIMQILTPSKN